MEKSKSNWKIKEAIKSFLGDEITTYKIITRWFEHENSRNPVEVTKVMASTGSKETANLIAVAPEMLDMLKECKNVLDIYKDNFTVEIEELITKAEGK